MFKPVNQKEDFPSLEVNITKFWKENSIFEKSINNRSINNKYVFYDGPPFITGTPHYGSLLPSIAKDVIPRYQTMRGKRVERVWGWDCHGLPIETKVEKTLNIKNRKEIEDFGVQRFIDECYKYTRNTSAEWKWYIDRIGRWVDFDNSYKTMDQDYMESVIHTFKELYDKNKVYEGVRTSLYCTRCCTPVSNFEIAMDNSYADMEDPAVTIKFPILTEGEFKDANVLAWTTTPWTLPSNKALVVDENADYVLLKVQKLNIELEKVWLVKELPENVNKYRKSNITQAYLDNYTDESGINIKHARIRKKDDEYSLTIKYFAGSKAETGQLIEKTELITKDKYISLIKQAKSKVVKIRTYIPLDNGLTAELDQYQNNLKGLNVVEVEFPSLSLLKTFKLPDWFSKELTDSNGVYPPFIADKSIEEINKINEEYVQKEHNYDGNIIEENIIIGRERIKEVLNNKDYKVLKEFKGSKLIGLKYDPPFKFFNAEENEHKIYSFENMVTMDEGTGIVHSAPGFGDIDTEMGKHYGLTIAMSINDEGKYIDIVNEYKGIYVKDADPLITRDLEKSNRLFKQERIVHRYPFCYRCSTPLLQKAQPSWFVDVQSIKNDLLKYNQNINWVPSHLKKGRFRKGIETAPDWCVSRTRYWASPMPVWQRIEDGKVVERVVLGSRDEIRENAILKITKIVLVRHSEDSRLVNEFNQKINKKSFDYLIHSEEFKESPLLDKSLKEISDKAFGNKEMHNDFKNIQDKLLKENNVGSLSDLSEEVLEKEFNSLIDKYKKELNRILEEYKGKCILALTHAEIIVFLRHIYEGRSLKESFSLNVKPLNTINMYFNGIELMDLHRPKIDKITIKGKTGELTRVKEVLDVWMDSASMPYSSKHYPFEDKKDFEENFPADFVIEYIAQTRAWFYVMHVLGVALFNSNPFKNVVTTGVIFGTDGRKMSKSYGNYPDPKLTIEKYGAEPLRIYLMGSPIMVGEDINLDENSIKDQVRNFLLPIWNCYSFFVTYANIHNKKCEYNSNSDDKLDVWIKVIFNETLKNVIKYFDEYNLPAVVKEYYNFIDQLSKWYIRRSRDRFALGDINALNTLYRILIDLSKLIAPIAPFISEEIFKNLTSQDKNFEESVHLSDYPVVDDKLLKENINIIKEMEFIRDVVYKGQSIRAKLGIKVRQPLSTIYILSNFNKEEWMNKLIQDELNVKSVEWVSKIPKNKSIEILELTNSKELIGLNIEVNDELLKEGILRDFIRLIQDQRKKMGLIMGDIIGIQFSISDTIIVDIIKNNESELKSVLSAKSIDNIDKLEGESKIINDKKIIIKINK